jgi:uncharacterized protein YfiM (DUF2279 family)
MDRGYVASASPRLCMNLGLTKSKWGLDENDLQSMPPSFIDGYSSAGTDNKLSMIFSKTRSKLIRINFSEDFGDNLGRIDGINAGRKLMRGSWNAQAWSTLLNFQLSGLNEGTDMHFYKGKSSGECWKSQALTSSH